MGLHGNNTSDAWGYMQTKYKNITFRVDTYKGLKLGRNGRWRRAGPALILLPVVRPLLLQNLGVLCLKLIVRLPLEHRPVDASPRRPEECFGSFLLVVVAELERPDFVPRNCISEQKKNRYIKEGAMRYVRSLGGDTAYMPIVQYLRAPLGND